MKNLYCAARERRLRKLNLSLANTMMRALIRPATMMVCLAAGFVVIGGLVSAGIVPKVQIDNPQFHATPQQTWDQREAQDKADQLRKTEATVAALMKKYNCWGREAPADMRGQIPGGAVMATHGFVHYTEYPPEVGIALDRAVKGKYKGIVDVYGFCRGSAYKTISTP